MTIITGLLRIAEIERSRRLDRFSEVRLGLLLREVGDLYEPIAEDKRVTLRVEAADEATVHGDRDLLFEAVVNLVDNAVKFTPEGGCVELGLLRRDGETVIRVSDTGPGIPEAVCDRQPAWLPAYQWRQSGLHGGDCLPAAALKGGRSSRRSSKLFALKSNLAF